MFRPSPTPDYDRRLFALGDDIASGPFRMVDRPRALRWASLTGIFGSLGLGLEQFGPVLEWSCFGIAVGATARVAQLLVDKSTWIERRVPDMSRIMPDLMTKR